MGFWGVMMMDLDLDLDLDLGSGLTLTGTCMRCVRDDVGCGELL